MDNLLFPFIFVLLLTQVAAVSKFFKERAASSFSGSHSLQFGHAGRGVCRLLMSGRDSHKAPDRSARSEDV